MVSGVAWFFGFCRGMKNRESARECNKRKRERKLRKKEKERKGMWWERETMEKEFVVQRGSEREPVRDIRKDRRERERERERERRRE